jgi:uncharacterized protein (TIGR02265 family)
MSNVKAIDLLIIKKMLMTRDSDYEKKLSMVVQPETLKQFQNVLAFQWFPIEREAEIISAAAQILFPNDERAVFRLGFEVAKAQFTGIYKIFIKIPSIEFVVKNVSKTWNTMNDQGEARVENLTDHSGTLVVSGISEMSGCQREYICGLLTCVLELTGVKNIHIIKIETDSQQWKWKLSWDKK